ncbi:RHS repeat-associated core domain-containing protein [Burkholderia sp. GbtcB21]|uniref:RHS repeat-associated core domain-containing protein n=1 Tax=Burkholderia sp. GbtcB21 TaxID=2824766 RepID=UPI001C2F76A7|nr:RHS repeat-associated core domain-containing protein [Burkholderia sp. GbtcB21]
MNSYCGTLPGSFSVDNNGGATYKIDVAVPPGIAGIAPELAFVYSSLATNGPIGVGWALDGLSVIERCAPTLAQDGLLAGVTFSDTDRLALDGARLVPRSGASYFGQNTVYETEIQSWDQVIPIYQGTPGRQGPDAFEVHQRNGRILRYGATPDAQAVMSSAGDSSIRAWYLSSIADRSGNTIAFSYIDAGSSGFKLPSAIRYTSNARAGAEARRSIVFDYEDRTDVESGYIAGRPYAKRRRLSTVATRVDDAVVSRYALTYEYGFATGRSRLVSITRADGQGVALPPTKFDWLEATANFGPATQLDIDSLQWGGSFLPMDIDGDGHVDFVNAYSDGGKLAMQIFLANRTGGFDGPFDVPPTGLRYGGQLVALDANGDGRMELVYAANNNGSLGLTLFVSALQDGNWTLVPGPMNSAGPSDLKAGGILVAADVDGDGLADLVLTFQNSGKLGVKTLFSDGTRFAPSPDDQTTLTAPYGGTLYACDANADGRDDLIYATKTDNGRHLALTLLRSHGRAGFVQIDDVLDGTVPAGGQIVPIDVNADGNTDLVVFASDTGKLTTRVLLNDGGVFHAGDPTSTGLPYGGVIAPATLTGSSSPEVLVLTHDTDNKLIVSAFRTGPSGLTPLPVLRQPPAGTLAGGLAMPLDLRGRGLSDLVYAINAKGKQNAIVMAVAGPYPDLLTTVTNGVGGQYALSYAPMSDPAVYSSTGAAKGAMEPRALLHALVNGSGASVGTAQWPNSTGGRPVLARTPLPKYLVRSFTKADGIGGQWQTVCRYENALIDRSGRGWLGFAAVETDDQDADTTLRDELHQVFPLVQHVSRSRLTRTSDGALMMTTMHSYETPQAGQSYQVLETSTATAHYSFAASEAAPDTILTVDTVYGPYGNVTQRTTAGTALAAGPTVLAQEFDTDEASWQIGLLSKKTVYAGTVLDDTKVLHRERFTYDLDSWLPITHDRWNNANEGQWLTEITKRDRFGRIHQQTDPAGTVKTTEYETEFQTFVQSESTTVDAAKTLTWQFTHESAFGACTLRVDPASAVEQHVVDGLGRTVSILRTAPDGTLVEVLRTRWSMEGGLLCAATSQRLDWTTDNWTTHCVFADGLGRHVRVERDPPEGTRPIVVETTYNGHGAKQTQTLPRFKGEPSVGATWIYDAFGRVIKFEAPAANGSTTTTISAYPRVDITETTVASGTSSARTTTVHHALCGKQHVPINRTDNAGAVTQYAYDGLGRLLLLTDPTGIVTSATYDSLGRQIAIAISQDHTTLSSSTVTYQDPTRTTIETTPIDVQTDGSVTIVKDGLQRIISKRTSDGQQTAFIYDETDVPYGIGRLTTVKLPNGDVLRYGYDAQGNVARRDVTLSDVTSQVTRIFDPRGKTTTTTFPDGSQQRNVYAPNGALLGVDFTPSGLPLRRVLGYSGFDAHDNPATLALANGLTCDIDYDLYGRLAGQLVTDTHNHSMFAYQVSRELNDSIGSLGDPVSLQMLAYDPAGRLASTTGGAIPPQSFQYDASGNCLSAGGTTFACNGYRVVSGTGEGAFIADYNMAGGIVSLTRDGATLAYTYDAEQRLVHVADSASGRQATYTYDALGNRLTKDEAGVRTLYVDPQYEIVYFADGSRQHSCLISLRGSKAYIYTIADSGSPPALEGIPVPGEAFFICDQVHSPRAAFDGTGELIARIDYDPFGAIAALQGTRSFRYSFSGREFDSVASAYYFGARYCDPRLRRFITSDDQLGGSLLDRDTANVYAYVENDPVGLIDLDGHSIWDFVAQVAVGVLAVGVGIAVSVASLGLAAPLGASIGVLGATLVTAAVGAAAGAAIGAGTGGLIYDATKAIQHKANQVSWSQWGVKVGIGAATGAVAGGVGGAMAPFASVAADTAVAALGAGEALSGVMQATVKAITTALVMVEPDTVTSVGNQLLSNAIQGKSVTDGLATAWAFGVAAGVLGSAASGILTKVAGPIDKQVLGMVAYANGEAFDTVVKASISSWLTQSMPKVLFGKLQSFGRGLMDRPV